MKNWKTLSHSSKEEPEKCALKMLFYPKEWNVVIYQNPEFVIYLSIQGNLMIKSNKKMENPKGCCQIFRTLGSLKLYKPHILMVSVLQCG